MPVMMCGNYFRWYLRRLALTRSCRLCLSSRKCSTPAVSQCQVPTTTATMTTALDRPPTGRHASTAPTTGFTTGKSSWIPWLVGVPAADHMAIRRPASC